MGITGTIALWVFVIASMLGIGLRVSMRELRIELRAYGFLLRALAANFVLIPLLGVALAWLVPMDDPSMVAFVLLACAAGGPSALQFTSKQRAALSYAAETAVLLAILSIFITPVLAELALPKDIRLMMPYARQFWLYLLVLVGPVVLGMLVHSKAPTVAARLAQPMTLLGTLAFVLVVLVLLEVRSQAIRDLPLEVVSAMVGFILLSMAVGWLMGGAARQTRRVLATSSSMRNIALCLVVVESSFAGGGVKVPLLAFSALMIPPNLIFFVVTMLRDLRAHGRAGPDQTPHQEDDHKATDE